MLYRSALASIFATGLLSLWIGTVAHAADFSATGTFFADNQAALFAFASDGATPITLRTYSYAGGTNAAGTTVTAGGFDPVLSLFDANYQVRGYHDDGLPGTVPTDPTTGNASDANWQLTLPSGTYYVALSQYDNFAAGPSMADGFLYTDPNFTAQYGAPGSRFLDYLGNQRTGNWAFDITGAVGAAAVPEPGTTAMMLAGLALYSIRFTRRRK